MNLSLLKDMSSPVSCIVEEVSKILKNFFGETVGYNKVSELAETFNIARKAWEETTKRGAKSFKTNSS